MSQTLYCHRTKLNFCNIEPTSVFRCVADFKPSGQLTSFLAQQGVQTVEIGTGGYPGNAHCKPAELLANPGKIKELKATVEKHGLEIACLSCHGNPVHPQKHIADSFDREYTDTVLLAEKLGVNRIVTFSGCPGDYADSRYPNWVTCPWPPDFLDVLEYQ